MPEERYTFRVAGGDTPFLAKKLHALSGVVPLGVFLLGHVWTSARVLGGEAAYARALDRLARMPGAAVLERIFVYAPLAYHAAYGLVAAFRPRADAPHPYPTKRLYDLARASGVGALVFIGWHVWKLRGVHRAYAYAALATQLSATAASVPFVALAYLAGLVATVFHFAAGAWAFGVSWGWLTTPASRRRAAYGAGALGAVVFVAGALAVVQLATGPLTVGAALGAPTTPCP